MTLVLCEDPSVSAVCSVTSVMSDSFQPLDCNPSGSSVRGILQAGVTGVGCHLLLQGIFPTQGSNPRLLCLPCWQADFFFYH